MKIGDSVIINNETLLSYERSGIIEDFENPKSRGEDSLILVKFNPYVYEWFFGKELRLIENCKE